MGSTLPGNVYGIKITEFLGNIKEPVDKGVVDAVIDPMQGGDDDPFGLFFPGDRSWGVTVAHKSPFTQDICTKTPDASQNAGKMQQGVIYLLRQAAFRVIPPAGRVTVTVIFPPREFR